ncbi:DUF2971 domain-containing protein [Vibrio crassostreae]|uniref:DUF2971 domain-containing protein n=1 Tax=Vibrio crassostreae TaxID=246167 RepID=UPI001B313848|nr:DUF2971 domain-containing protein [Vibrio crassostreae]
MKLYKYRKFSEFLVRELCSSKIYFSDPKLFNDPLDCTPVVANDLTDSDLEKLCFEMITRSKGRKTAKETIESFRYYSLERETPRDQRESFIYQLNFEVKKQLDEIFKEMGVLSLSAKHDSPLMWSHYADEHKGICLEFDMVDAVALPKQIDYEGGRSISSKLIFQYIVDGNKEASKEIKDKYFFAKSEEWSYESEWRLLARRYGENSLPFRLTGVYFGMRCDSWVMAAIMKLLYSETSDINFFKMYADTSSFKLHNHLLEPREYINVPRPSAALAFGKIGR